MDAPEDEDDTDGADELLEELELLRVGVIIGVVEASEGVGGILGVEEVMEEGDGCKAV